MVLSRKDSTALCHVGSMGYGKTDTTWCGIYVESKKVKLIKAGWMVASRGLGWKKWENVGKMVQSISYAEWVNSGESNVLILVFSSVQSSHWVVSDSLQPHGLQHAGPSCSSPALRAYSNSCPLSRWCHPPVSSSVVPFSFRLQSFPASESFQMSQFFASGGQSIGVSA